jgi:hypothetical protein
MDIFQQSLVFQEASRDNPKQAQMMFAASAHFSILDMDILREIVMDSEL